MPQQRQRSADSPSLCTEPQLGHKDQRVRMVELPTSDYPLDGPLFRWQDTEVISSLGQTEEVPDRELIAIETRLVSRLQSNASAKLAAEGCEPTSLVSPPATRSP